MQLGNDLLTISDIFETIKRNDFEDFMDYLSQTEVTWGSPNTLTLINKAEIEKHIILWISEFECGDPNDIQQIIANYPHEYIVIR